MKREISYEATAEALQGLLGDAHIAQAVTNVKALQGLIQKLGWALRGEMELRLLAKQANERLSCELAAAEAKAYVDRLRFVDALRALVEAVEGEKP